MFLYNIFNKLNKMGCKFKICLMLFVVVNITVAHQKDMHQYLTREAFKLLQKSFPGQLTDMAIFIGTNEVYLPNSWSLSTGSCRIVSGAWIEDETDVVYHYGIGAEPTYNQGSAINFLVDAVGSGKEAYTSITHFWDADRGVNSNVFLNDYSKTILDIKTYWSFSIPENAFLKIKKYENGVYRFRDFYFPKKVNLACVENQPGNIAFASDWSVFPINDLYLNNPKMNATGYQYIDGNWYKPNCTITSFVLPPKFLAYEILGRMCHLLQDMSVPEHVQCVSHAKKNGMRTSVYEENEASFKQWTADEIYSKGNYYFNPFFKTSNNSDPLYNLMYVLNEITDHYASAGSDGDDNFDPAYFAIRKRMSSLGLPIKTSEISIEKYKAMHDVLQPLTIQMTAGLLYWFAVNSGQLPAIPSQENNNIISILNYLLE